MKTNHTFIFQNSSNLENIPSDSLELMVTSPPYPMIEMWDTCFADQNPQIADALIKDPNHAFELMHKMLDKVWNQAFRVLKPGGFACINIGDATRTFNEFAVFSNHSRILHHLAQIGFTILPEIIWRKQTNAPNKFMGSGMLPAGAYVTLEHEYILIARKGGKRVFKSNEEKLNRRQSAIFWEERNLFFSDIWFDIKGTRQGLPGTETGKEPDMQSVRQLRKRSAAFPFELAYRLINMYSVKGDTVFDPFLGTGTTMAAGMAAARNTIGCEIESFFQDSILKIKNTILDFANHYIKNRLLNHMDFVEKRTQSGKFLKHKNQPYNFPVMTKQEEDLIFNELISVNTGKDKSFHVTYSDK